MNNNTTFHEWVAHGMAQGWCSPPICQTHDGVPMTPTEIDETDEGGDPCIHVVRLYARRQDQTDAEEGDLNVQQRAKMFLSNKGE